MDPERQVALRGPCYHLNKQTCSGDNKLSIYINENWIAKETHAEQTLCFFGFLHIYTLPIISATVRPLENLPLGSPLPKSIPYHGRLAWARLLLRYLLFPTSERESPNINCTILQLWPSMRRPKMVTAINATMTFMVDWYLARWKCASLGLPSKVEDLGLDLNTLYKDL